MSTSNPQGVVDRQRQRQKQRETEGERDPVTTVFMRAHSIVSDSLQPWTVAPQAPLSIEFSRQLYWSGLPFPSLGDLPDPGIELTFLVSSALAGRFSTTVPPGKPQLQDSRLYIKLDARANYFTQRQKYKWKQRGIYFETFIHFPPSLPWLLPSSIPFLIKQYIRYYSKYGGRGEGC